MSDRMYLKVSEDKFFNLEPILFVEFTTDENRLMARIAYTGHEEHRLAGAEAEVLRRYLESVAASAPKAPGV
ncbi:MAG TPA: hypothetical protein VMT34_03600 [Aggregatilineales bacterium]|nr:hypothetical protein [Aggregatilineales bacterium]